MKVSVGKIRRLNRPDRSILDDGSDSRNSPENIPPVVRRSSQSHPH